jgi:hypothetical protein
MPWREPGPSLLPLMINRLDPYSLPKRHLNWVILRFLMRGKAPSEDQNLAFMRLALYGVFHLLNSLCEGELVAARVRPQKKSPATVRGEGSRSCTPVMDKHHGRKTQFILAVADLH